MYIYIYTLYILRDDVRMSFDNNAYLYELCISRPVRIYTYVNGDNDEPKPVLYTYTYI